MVGTITWTTITQVAGRPAAEPRQAVAAQRELGAGLGAGRQLDLPLALVARDRDVVPSIASIAEIVDLADQVVPLRWKLDRVDRSWPRIGRATSKPKPPPKNAWKMSSTEPKPPRAAAKPPERRPSWP